MHIFVAVPCRDTRIGVAAFKCLVGECEVARGIDDEITVSFLTGCSLLPHGRNVLVQRFMDSGADRMVFVDDDMSWNVGDLVKLARVPFDVVGAAGRSKEATERYAVHWLDKPELWANEAGLLEVASIGAGFLAINRCVFEALKKAHPERGYCGDEGNDVFCYFYVPFLDIFYGEDAAFCRDWRLAGGRVWLDPTITLGHWEGRDCYKGNIGKWLKGRID